MKSCKIAAWVQRSAGPGSAARPGKDGSDLLCPARRPADSLAFIIPSFFFLLLFFRLPLSPLLYNLTEQTEAFPKPSRVISLVHLVFRIVFGTGEVCPFRRDSLDQMKPALA